VKTVSYFIILLGFVLEMENTVGFTAALSQNPQSFSQEIRVICADLLLVMCMIRATVKTGKGTWKR
jgi:hypothetical protein